MADLKKTIEIIFGASDGVSPVVSSIQSKLNDLNNISGTISATAEPFGNIADSILKVESSLIGLGVAYSTYAVSGAIKLEDAQKSLQKVLGEGEGIASDYTDKIRELSLYYAEDPIGITEAVTSFKQAGFTIEESLKLVENSLTAVKIAELDINQASALLVSTLKGLGDEAENASHYLDSWNAISNEYSTNALEVARATAQLAPIAQTAGLSFDQMVGLVTPIIESFRSGSEAGNALKVSLARLIDDGGAVSDTLYELGINQKDANGQLKTSGEILNELGLVWNNYTEAQKASYASTLFGKEQYARILPILNEYGKVLEITAKSAGSAGSAQAELAVALSKTSTIVDRVKIAFGILNNAFGENLLQGVGSLSLGISNIASALLKVIENGNLKPIFDAMNKALSSFGSTLTKISSILPDAFGNVDFTRLLNSFRNLGGEFEKLLSFIFDDLDFTNVDDLSEALQRIIDLFAFLTDVTKGIIAEFEPFFQVIGKAGKATEETSRETAEAIGGFLGFAKAVSDFGVVLSGLQKTVKETGVDVGVVLNDVVQGVRLFINALQLAFDGAVIAVSKTAELWANVMSKAVYLLDDDLYETFKGFEASFSQTADNASKSFDENLKDMENSANSFGKDLFALGEDGETVFNKLNNATKEVDKNIAKTGESTDKVKTTQQELVDLKEKELNRQKEIAQEIIKAEADAIIKLEEQKALEQERIERLKQYNLEVEKLSTQKIVKVLELDIANAQRDAETFAKSIDGTVAVLETTGSQLDTIFGRLGTGDWYTDQKLLNQAKKENRLREEASTQQKELIDAQVSYFEAKADSLKSGQGEISISADGLEPELEAFMWAILDRIRLRASEDQANFLLGITS